MKNLNNVSKLTKEVLEEDEQSRNSNMRLYSKVVAKLNPGREEEIERLLTNSGLVLPPFETVTRVRRKIVEKNPELQANDKVVEFRVEQEEEYREFART